MAQVVGDFSTFRECQCWCWYRKWPNTFSTFGNDSTLFQLSGMSMSMSMLMSGMTQHFFNFSGMSMSMWRNFPWCQDDSALFHECSMWMFDTWKMERWTDGLMALTERPNNKSPFEVVRSTNFLTQGLSLDQYKNNEMSSFWIGCLVPPQSIL